MRLTSLDSDEPLDSTRAARRRVLAVVAIFLIVGLAGVIEALLLPSAGGVFRAVGLLLIALAALIFPFRALGLLRFLDQERRLSRRPFSSQPAAGVGYQSADRTGERSPNP